MVSDPREGLGKTNFNTLVIEIDPPILFFIKGTFRNQFNIHQICKVINGKFLKSNEQRLPMTPEVQFPRLEKFLAVSRVLEKGQELF